MGLTVTRISVRDFRNYIEFELEVDPVLTVLTGPNAVGKTNLIEAVELLTEANSFRRPSWAETIRQGSDQARLSLQAEGEGRHLDIELDVTAQGRRIYRVNGKTRRSVTQVAGIIPCVVFTPDDLRMVKDSAERRRAALDSLGSQLSPTYARLKTEYDRVLRQRNKLLRDEEGPLLLEPWTERLIDTGARLVTHRRRLFERVNDALVEIYSKLTDGGSIRARYLASWERDGLASSSSEPGELMSEHLAAHEKAEKARHTTLTGPHRDDIAFEIEGRDARAYGSQGQQRTVALAWKLAEVDVVTGVSSQRPVLLLDDVMSELDERRRHSLAALVGSSAQTIVTTTNLGYFDEDLLARARVVKLG